MKSNTPEPTRRLSSVMQRLARGQSRPQESDAEISGSTTVHSLASSEIVPENRTIFQAFEWYTEADHWTRLTKLIPYLKQIGIDAIWLPPGCKAAWPDGNGYAIYDLYDLGEFEQKGTTATKWGTKEELSQLSETARSHGLDLYWDAVLNHRAGGDAKETCMAVRVDPKDRTKEIEEPHEVEAWSSFTFPGRAGKYNTFQYSWRSFSGIDWDDRSRTHGIYKFIGDGKSGWAEDVSKENGNYDFLFFADLDYCQPKVPQEVLRWATWITKEVGLRGMRLDAIKHYSFSFVRELVQHLVNEFGEDFFLVGEYWTWNSRQLVKFIDACAGRLHLFDVQLLYNLYDLSNGKRADLRIVFEGTLVKMRPANSVTFVQNHDTQDTQSLEAPVEPWFIPHAYALVLLRAEGCPCTFYGDLFGTNGPKSRLPACGGKLPRLILARKLYAYGHQKDYFDEADCVGWTRSGHSSRSSGAGLAVVISISWDCCVKRMNVGLSHRGELWTDLMGWAWGRVKIDNAGFGEFPVGYRSISVWTNIDAPGRERSVDIKPPQGPRGLRDLSGVSDLASTKS